MNTAFSFFNLLLIVEIFAVLISTGGALYYATCLTKDDFVEGLNDSQKYTILPGLSFRAFGHWRFLTEVVHLDLDLDVFTGLWYNQVPNFGSLS